MSGSGRKSQYRKSVTIKVLNDYPEPRDTNDEIVRVMASRGSNLFEVQHANGTVSLTMLPQKFQRLIWIKRDDYLIVTLGDRDRKNANKGAVTSIVLHILYKKQVKHLKDKKLWPKEFEHAESGPCVELGDAVMDEYSANEFTVQRHTANRNRRVQDVEDDEDDE